MSEEKSYLIKVPVFTTEMVEKENDLFGETYSELISAVKKKIEEFVGTLMLENRDKTQYTVIDNIAYSEHLIGDIPCLLLRICAYTTNLLDGYYEANERHQFERESRIGSDNNFVLIYPVIAGVESNRYIRYFLLLVYEDPNKDSSSNLIKIAKIVAKKVLSIPTKNIKPQVVLDELSKMSTIPELQVKYYGISHSENDVDVKFREYLQAGKVKREKAQYFKDMPFDLVPDLLQENDDNRDYQTWKIKFNIGKKEYKLTKERKEAGELYKETAEKVFNTSIGITQSELDSNKIYQPDFIIEKLGPVVTNYLVSEVE